jgi:hypothetical protein
MATGLRNDRPNERQVQIDQTVANQMRGHKEEKVEVRQQRKEPHESQGQHESAHFDLSKQAHKETALFRASNAYRAWQIDRAKRAY